MPDPHRHEAGHGYGTAERVSQAMRTLSYPNSGHGVDGAMDRIASQSRIYTSANPNDADGRAVGVEVRSSLEKHRREMQLAAICKAAKRAQTTVSLPKEKKNLIRGASGGAGLIFAQRRQRTGGPAGQSTLSRSLDHRSENARAPAATRGRSSGPAEREQGERKRADSRTIREPGYRPARIGGNQGVPTPPHRPVPSRAGYAEETYTHAR